MQFRYSGMNKILSGCFRRLKNKGKAQLDNPKSGGGRLRQPFITKFKSYFKRRFTKVVVTRAGRLREWSRGKLRLNLQCSMGPDL